MCMGSSKRRSSSLFSSEKFKSIVEGIQTSTDQESSETCDPCFQSDLPNCELFDDKFKQNPIPITSTNIKSTSLDDSSGISVPFNHSAKSSTIIDSPVLSSLKNVDIVTSSDASMLSNIDSNGRKKISLKPKIKYSRKPKKLKPGLTGTKRTRVFVEHDYHDHSNDSEKDRVYDDNNRNKKRKQNAGGVVVPFPEKLHKLLDELEEQSLASILSWQPHGRAFAIHNKKRFIDEVMPKYFKQTRFASFLRQLNLYGFVRLSSGRDKGAYYHELFLRGKYFLCKKIIRIKCKGTGLKAASDPDAEPDFFSMPFVSYSRNNNGATTYVKDQYENDTWNREKSVSIISVDSIYDSLDDSSLDAYDKKHDNIEKRNLPKSVTISQPRNKGSRRTSVDGSVIDDMIVDTLLANDNTEQCREMTDFTQANEVTDDFHESYFNSNHLCDSSCSYALNHPYTDDKAYNEPVNQVPVITYSMGLEINDDEKASPKIEPVTPSMGKAPVLRRESSSFCFDGTLDEFMNTGLAGLDDDDEDELRNCLETIMS